MNAPYLTALSICQFPLIHALAHDAFSISAAGIIISDDPYLQMVQAEDKPNRFILYNSSVIMISLSSPTEKWWLKCRQKAKV